MPQQQGRMRVVGEIVLQSFRVIFVGVAVAATVGAGVIVSQSPAFQAKAPGAVPFVGSFLEMDAD